MNNEENDIVGLNKNNDNEEGTSNKKEEQNNKENDNNIILNKNENIQIEIKENNIDKSDENTIINLNDFINHIKYNYYDKKIEIKEQEKQKNIIQEYIENKNIIKDKNKLKSFIEELSNILKIGNNTIIPFLDLCPILIKSYIDSDLDEEKGENELKYVKIFELLKYNSFISREYLYPLYDYFAHLFYLKDTIEESDQILNKFNKMIELLNIFYSFYPDNYPKIESKEEEEKINNTKTMDKNKSNFCLLGSGLKFEFNQKIIFEDCLIIVINFDTNIFEELNQNLILLNLKGENNNFELKYIDVKEKTKKDEFPIKIRIQIIQNIINITTFYSDVNTINQSLEFPDNYNSFQDLIILENFYGQISDLSVNFCKVNSSITFEYASKPYLLIDNTFYCDNGFIKEISFTKPKLGKVNYINYLEKDFDLENYFLGIKQLIPFIPLLNGLYQNQKINNINGIDKKSSLTEAFRKIVLNFITTILEKKLRKNKPSKSNKSSKKNVMEFTDENDDTIILENESINMLNIQKYDLFTFILILQLPPELIIRGYLNPDEKTNNFITKLMQKSVEIYNNDEIDFDLFFNGLFNATDEDEFYTEHVNEQKVFAKLQKDLDSTNSLLFEYSYQQLFRKIMKELFIYNRLWSVKEFFFSNEYNDNKELKEYFSKLKIKYKQLSYYTKSLEQPILYPILEINEYLPHFSKFNKNNLFNHDFNLTVNYDFNLKESKIFEYIDSYLLKKDPFNQEKIKVQCCLVKKGYHVKGEMIIKQVEKNTKNKEYCLMFRTNDKEMTTTCNKKIEKKKVRKSKMDELCFGSVFSCPKKEYERKIVINLEDINLILIRNYFKSTSAVEIFTDKNNKSYYFNFSSPITLKSIKNPIIKLFSEIQFYHKIKVDLKKNLGGFYNIKQNNILFYLFSEELPNSIYKYLELVNLYDLLTFINLLANRSFKDLYQYPVFPILYNKSKILEQEKIQERDLSKHLGLQVITKKSEQRMELILGSDNASENETDNSISSRRRKSKENYLFNIHYSNPIFVCNYLIRIFPYSITAIELQGDGFDSPNRQFYSLKKSLENTLIQKSDLREFIPEMFYLPDLFFNKNNIKFGTLTTGEEINDIYIDNKDEDNYIKYKYLEEFKSYFLHNKELNISSWINLIFGINQEKSDDIGREYYSKEKYIPLGKKEQKDEINNPFNLEIVEFGLQPLKIFEENFPDLRKINMNYYNSKLINNNVDEFYNTHLIVKNNKDICFCLEWDENVQLNKYINALILKEKTDKNKFLNLSFYYKYRFIGNLLGDVFIYQSKNIINSKDNESKEGDQSIYKNFFSRQNKNFEDITKNPDKIVYKLKKEKNKNEKLLIKLSDHYKQIKYIDYNPRLNLFLSYSLDGFIHIYVFPKCKLVRTIKVKDITNSDDVLQKVVLISLPFPMIFFNDSNYLYCLSINGEFITKKEMKKNVKTFACVDKNLGLMNDTILELIFHPDKNENKKYEIKSITFPSLEY